MGILDAASDSTVGTVSAAGDLTTPANQVIDVYLPADDLDHGDADDGTRRRFRRCAGVRRRRRRHGGGRVDRHRSPARQRPPHGRMDLVAQPDQPDRS